MAGNYRAVSNLMKHFHFNSWQMKWKYVQCENIIYKGMATNSLKICKSLFDSHYDWICSFSFLTNAQIYFINYCHTRDMECSSNWKIVFKRHKLLSFHCFFSHSLIVIISSLPYSQIHSFNFRYLLHFGLNVLPLMRYFRFFPRIHWTKKNEWYCQTSAGRIRLRNSKRIVV